MSRVHSVLCDSGYLGQPLALGVQAILGEYVGVQIAKRSELHTFKVMPKRSIIERSFGWLDKNKRLCKHCKLAQHQLAVCQPGVSGSLAQETLNAVLVLDTQWL